MTKAKAGRDYVGRFSGTAYTNARGLGDYQWKPQDDSWQGQVLPVIEQILVDEAAYLPLRPRAILYRLMGKRLATKADNKRLNNLVADARRSGYIEWEDIDDGRTVTYDIGGFSGPADYWAWVKRSVSSTYRRHRRTDQPWWIEIYVESAGYLPVLERTAAAFGAVVISGSGFNTVARLRQTALEAHERYDSGQRTAILFLGDYDPSGVIRMDRSDADIRQFFIDSCVEYGGGRSDEVGNWMSAEDLCEYVIESRWIGLRPEQAAELQLPEDPEKPGKWELEAVPPATVIAWVTEALAEFTDADELAAVKAASVADQIGLTASLDRLAKREQKKLRPTSGS